MTQEHTAHGFTFGNITVEAAVEKKVRGNGWIVVTTPLHKVLVGVDRAGRVMVYQDDELLVPLEHVEIKGFLK